MGNNTKDLILDSKGHCFFCLENISTIRHDQEFVKYSLYYLSRYLKMDMRKVFSDMEQIPSHLLAKVKNSRLKVGLCGQCACLNEKFSETYRKLEQVKIELGSCLKLIHEKLLDASRTCKTEQFKNLTDVKPQLKLSNDGELEILEVLREEAFQKSNHKLRAVAPRVKFHNLSRKEIRAKTKKFKKVPNEQKQTLLSSDMSNLESDLMASDCQIKMETQDILSNDDDWASDDIITHDDAMREDFGDTNLVMKDHNDMSYTGLGPSVAPNFVTKIHLESETERPMWSIIPDTGKYKCDTCSMEFADKGAVQRHYKSVHLKVRFKCVTCGKQFVQKSHCLRHQKTAHVGVRYACQVCNKSFSYTSDVLRHQRTTRCGKK